MSNRLPPKTRYDDPIPEGTPIEQWRWLISNWLAPTRAFASQLARFDKGLAEVEEKRSALASTGTPGEVDRRAIVATLDEITMNRQALSVWQMDAEEALADIETMQARLTSTLAIDPAKLSAKIARFNAHVAEMEAGTRGSYERLKAEAAKVVAACPDYQDFSGEFPIFAFFVRDHLGGAQPKGWVTVSEA